MELINNEVIILIKNSKSKILSKIDEIFFEENIQKTILTYEDFTYIEKAVNTTIGHLPLIIITDAPNDLEKLLETIVSKNPAGNHVGILPRINFLYSNPSRHYIDYISTNYHKFNNITLIGYQAYYTDPKLFKYLESINIEMYRLAEVANETEKIEPELREADSVYIDLSSLKNSDFKSTDNQCPNGFNTLEFSKIIYYLGINIKIPTIIFYGYKEYLDINSIDANLLVNFLWHFIDSLNRKKEINNLDSDRKIYIISKPEFEKIKFLHCQKTNRWWIEINNQYYACNYEDFQEAKEGIITKRIQRIKRLKN